MVIYEEREITAQTDEILAISFGEIHPPSGCVLTNFRVRTFENGLAVEGSRDGVFVHYDILAALQKFSPQLFQLMADKGADKDVLPPPLGPVPHWNSGTTIKSCGTKLYSCEQFGFAKVLPEFGAVVAYIEVKGLPKGAGTFGADYLLSHRVVNELSESLPKVLRKMQQKGIGKAKR